MERQEDYRIPAEFGRIGDGSLRGSGRLDTRLDTPPISYRHHPVSRLAPLPNEGGHRSSQGRPDRGAAKSRSRHRVESTSSALHSISSTGLDILPRRSLPSLEYDLA